MFEVRIMVEDSKLHKVLWALDGMIVGMPQMLPVRNAVPSKDKKQVKENVSAIHGTVSTRFLEALKSLGTSFTWKLAAGTMEAMGVTRSATSAYLNRLHKAKKIIRIGRGRYEVVSE